MKLIELATLVAALSASGAAFGVDNAKYCNAVQNRVGFIRYPLGTIGAWTSGSGETADVITRAPRIYPCVGSPVAKVEKEDWRASVTGDPSALNIQYREDKPSGASRVAITVSPHVSVFQTTFREGARDKHLVLDFRKPTVDNWARLYKWTDRKVTRIDDRTFQATIGEPGKKGAFYVIKFSVPCVASGFIEPSGAVAEGATNAVGTGPCLYARFDAPTVTVAVAESYTSLEKAAEFLASEFTDFEAVHRQCQAAWEKVLDRVELEGSETSKRMAYTALYTMYVNVIGADDGSHYAPACPRPVSIASSAYWQFIGGYQSCCWDNVRATYPFLMLAYPEMMSDVLNTYLARYQLDGCMDGDICLITGPSGHKNIRFSPVLVAQAYYSGVAADYGKLYAALNDNFHNEDYVSPSLWPLGRLTQLASGGFACSRSLEYNTGAAAMALLAANQNDPKSAQQYLGLSKTYTNMWDNTNRAFRLRNADGSWGPIDNDKMTWNPNPQGLFEGKTRDWMFAVPHDPYGLIHLPGQGDFVRRVEDYCLNDAWFNDYQEIYPYMLYYAGAADVAQKIIRTGWVPLFKEGIMYEGVKPKPPHGGWQTHYTGASGWLMCSMIGLYPGASPVGQYFISSPSVTKTVLRDGKHTLTVRTKNHSDENLYIRSIKLNGQPYPAYMIPAKRLVTAADLELEMGGDPQRGLGDLYVASTDGFLLEAELVAKDHLRFSVEAAGDDATTQVRSAARPARITVGGQPASQWDYDAAGRMVTLRTSGKVAVEILLR